MPNQLSPHLQPVKVHREVPASTTGRHWGKQAQSADAAYTLQSGVARLSETPPAQSSGPHVTRRSRLSATRTVGGFTLSLAIEVGSSCGEGRVGGSYKGQ